jgi:ribonuclease HII
VDEAGRGAWAGPVTAAVVILPPGRHPFVDSKEIKPAERAALADDVKRVALAYAVAHVPARDVDAIGILEATRRAVQRAVARIDITPQALVTDYLTRVGLPVRAPAKGESVSVQVAAASLLAKTERDRYMVEVAHRHDTRYGFERHKGYGVIAHREALARHGPGVEHRLTFQPVRSCLPAVSSRGSEGRTADLPDGLS